jgi:hypothetical protein
MQMMTREEILKLRPEFAELIAHRPPLKPKKPAPSAVVPLGEKVAEVAKANPAGLEVRVTARSGDGTTYIDPPKRPTEIIQPLEVDEAGRVARARRIDCTTAEASVLEYQGGYRQAPGAQHEYDPMAGLRRAEDE